MRYGRTVPSGFLPVFSVDTEEEARQLIILTCPRGDDGAYYARELIAEQTLENLQAFSDRLARGYELLSARRAERGLSPPSSSDASPGVDAPPAQPHPKEIWRNRRHRRACEILAVADADPKRGDDAIVRYRYFAEARRAEFVQMPLSRFLRSFTFVSPAP